MDILALPFDQFNNLHIDDDKSAATCCDTSVSMSQDSATKPMNDNLQNFWKNDSAQTLKNAPLDSLFSGLPEFLFMNGQMKDESPRFGSRIPYQDSASAATHNTDMNFSQFDSYESSCDIL